MSLLRKLAPILLLLLVAETAYLVIPQLRQRAAQPEESEALRGKRVAMKAGCFGCHGDGGHGHVQNAGSPAGVPGYREGVLMMYAESATELREWIETGCPKRLQQDKDYMAAREKLGFRMPPFKGKLTNAEIDSLVTYIMAVSQSLAPAPGTEEAQGLAVARQNGCFGCHGDLGMGGTGNLQSFKGYIPGFWGADFDELVHGDSELREWIERGTCDRLEANPLAAHYLASQTIAMPSFKGHLRPDEIGSLMAAVKWIHRTGWKKK